MKAETSIDIRRSHRVLIPIKTAEKDSDMGQIRSIAATTKSLVAAAARAADILCSETPSRKRTLADIPPRGRAESLPETVASSSDTLARRLSDHHQRVNRDGDHPSAAHPVDTQATEDIFQFIHGPMLVARSLTKHPDLNRTQRRVDWALESKSVVDQRHVSHHVPHVPARKQATDAPSHRSEPSVNKHAHPHDEHPLGMLPRDARGPHPHHAADRAAADDTAERWRASRYGAGAADGEAAGVTADAARGQAAQREAIKEAAMGASALVRRMFKLREVLPSVSSHNLPELYADVASLNQHVYALRRHLHKWWELGQAEPGTGTAPRAPRTEAFAPLRAIMLLKTEMMTLSAQVSLSPSGLYA